MITFRVSPWWLLVLAVPVLLLGEFLVRRLAVLDRLNIPVPVVGGLVVSLLVLVMNLLGVLTIVLETRVTAPWWTWLVVAEPEWIEGPALSVNHPFLVGFFTCIGLNARWQILRRGSGQLLVFWLLATLLAAVQSGLGVGLARLLGVPSLLGLVCGAVTMTGGHGTAAGFAEVIAAAGLPQAAVIGAAAATFGLVAGGLLGGPLGGWLIHGAKLASQDTTETTRHGGADRRADFVAEVRRLGGFGRRLVWHLLVLLFCIKAGAWFSYYLRQAGLVFPVYIGSMVLGVALRNMLDLAGKDWLETRVIDTLTLVLLGVFLAIALMSLRLEELANTALPMLVILLAQILVMALFAVSVTYRIMGSDYDGAVMAGGHCGFGLGATPNAVANMESLVGHFGSSPRAFLVVPLVGAFLIDFSNALVITVFLNWI